MGKGGGTETTTQNNYDPEYNSRMARVAERQQSMAEDQWNEYKQYFQDYEIEVANANKELLPYMSSSTREQLKFQEESSKANAELLPEFTKQAKEGVDVTKRMDEASNEVKAGAKLGESMRRREASRLGIDPGSSTFANASNKAALDTSRNISGSRTAAKNQAEQENFARLGLALGKTQGAVTTVNNADPYARAATTYSGAAATYAPLATKVLNSTQEKENNVGWMSLVGNVLGQGMGGFAGGYGSSMGMKMGQ